MDATGSVRRIILAFLLSTGVSAVLLCIAFSIDPRQSNLSSAQHLAVALLKPADVVTDWIAPGHTGMQFVILSLSAIVFYALVSWVVFSVLRWPRRQS